MPGQQSIAPQMDGTFNVQCKVCDGHPWPVVVATGIKSHKAAEDAVRQHRVDAHKFGGVVSVPAL